MIFVVKVSSSKEEKAAEMIADRAEQRNLNVYAVVQPHGMKGYLFVEAADRDSLEEATFNLPYTKGILVKNATYEEIKNMLEPKIEDVKIEIGDIVEIIGQTFKGEKAKVMRVDKQKGEVVVSLLGASVPIPVTIKLDNIKVIRREEKEEESKDDKLAKTEEFSEEDEELMYK